MTTELLINNYIQILSHDGFFREDENYYIKNMGSYYQQVLYNSVDQNYLQLNLTDNIEGKEINLFARVDYSTLKNYETAEELQEYIEYLIRVRKKELTNEIVCVNTLENIKNFQENLGYVCTKTIYDYPYITAYGFSYLEYPSGIKYEYIHISHTSYIKIIEENDEIIKTTILNYEEIQDLDQGNLVEKIKEIISLKH